MRERNLTPNRPIMATSAQPNGSKNVNNEIFVSVGLLIGLVAIIIFTAWILHRTRPPVTVSAFVRHLRRDEEQYRKSLGSYALESIPVVRYSERLLPNEQERVSEVYNSAPKVYLPRRDVPTMRDGGRPLYVNEEATGAEEHKKETTIKNFDMQGNNNRIPLEANASQNIDRSVSRQEPLSCSVCKEDFADSDDVRILPCGHIYHRRCIDPWLLDFAGTCPLCRIALQDVVALPTSLPEPPEPALLSSESAYGPHLDVPAIHRVLN